MSETIIQARVEDIVVDNRIRQDLGDLTDLQASIERHGGVLQPIGLTPSMRLVFGGRRLEAAKRNGCETIAARVFADFEAAEKAIYAERDENTQKPFTALEMRAMAKRLEELVPRSKGGRPAENIEETSEIETVPNLGTVSESPPREPRKPSKRRDRIAAAVGTSAENLRKIDTVATAAEQPDAPPEVKAAAEEMERTGKVEPAYQAVQAAKAPPPNPVDLIGAKVGSILETLGPLEREIRELCDLDPSRDRAKCIELLGKLIAAVKGQKRRMTPKPVDDTDRYVEQLWQLYPRKEGKGQAVKAIEKALKTASFFDLKPAVEEYAEAVATWPSEDLQYVPHAATWFNQRRWEDDRTMWRAKGAAASKTAGLEQFAASGGRRRRDVSSGVELIGGCDEPLPF